jgi:hypothetical protein
MKLYAIILPLLLIASPFYSVSAADVDPLWSKVIAQNKEVKKWAAKEIEQTVTATKDGDSSKTVNIKKQFSGWEKNKANYVIVSMTPPPSDGSKPPKAFDMAEMFDAIEAEVFSPQTAIKRSDGQVLNGKAVVLFEMSKSETQVKIWVDGNSGAIQKRIVEMSVPFTLEGSLLTNYQVNASGQSLPKDTETKLNIKIPFKKAKVEIKDTYSNWIAQP